jgi:NTE family protein
VPADPTFPSNAPRRRTRAFRCAIAFACGLALAPPTPAQPASTAPAASTPAGRPKVCLVLSGGGARGAAHIGVIKVLEELRVPIDCITGTSMGSLVGGAYASGMSVPEMEQLIEKITTSLLFKESPPRQEETIRRKIDDRSILFGLELGVRDGELLLQKGVVSGVQLEAVLRQVSKAQGYRRFDELPIPFRAVATDLVEGKAVVFDEGELARVMRASMSVPGVIAPAEIGDMLLVDGGLTDNLPVDVARAMGADIVIAVNLGTPLHTREQLGSVLGVTAQMISILTEQNVRASLASLKPTDILIQPALGRFSAADFDNLPKTVPIGEAAAREASARLRTLSLAPEAYAALRSRQQAPPAPERGVIADIRFPGLERVNPESLLDYLDSRPGEPLDPERLDRDLRRLYGSGDFEHVDYQIIEEAGRQIVSVSAIEKSWGPNYLRFGLGLQSDFKGANAFNLAASYRSTWLNPLGAEWRTDVQMGQVGYLATEWYQPLGTRNGLFIAPRATVLRRELDLYQGDDRIARYDLRTAYGSLDFGAQFTRYGEVRLGVSFGRTSASLDTGPQELAPPQNKVARGAFTFRAIVDQLDDANFPHEGFAAVLDVVSSARSLGAKDNYTRWDAIGVGAKSWGRHTVLLGGRFAGAASGDTLPPYDLVQWGGFLQQSGLPAGALLGQQLSFGRAIYYYKILEKRLIDGVYVGASAEVGRMDRPLVPNNLNGTIVSGALFVGADTPIGPVYLGWGIATGGHSSGYLFLGRP